MQSISTSPLPNCCNPYRLHHPNPRTNLSLQSFPKRNQTHFTNLCALIDLPQTQSCSTKDQDKINNRSDPYHNHSILLQFFSSTDSNSTNKQNPEAQNREEEEEQGDGENKNTKVIITNMWWVDFKGALGQRFNFGAIVCSARVVLKDRHLALPHVSVPDIRYIDWFELRKRGFKGVVFDKDNTITAPYQLNLWAPLASSLDECKAVFGPNIAVFSNSAGLYEYDHDGSKAKALEKAIGIKVIRHRVKKPAGTAEEVEKHFGCEASQLIMVRKLETSLVKCWSRKGLNTTSHRLLPDTTLCVIDPPNV
ncbi:hypothetical protein F8388_025387 [Cannabis sativa]|uniref:Uncharacterized protein n=1 Tax=Cannabis sativa TaxID=3483 RepID=A0A7J6G0M8_CANSA|nr:hypothetical protein F8388_025387 [Cannabis sativa]